MEPPLKKPKVDASARVHPGVWNLLVNALKTEPSVQRLKLGKKMKTWKAGVVEKLTDTVGEEIETDGIESFAEDVVDELVAAYVRFIATKLCDKDYGSTLYSPCNVVDELWHDHILDTQGYAAFCRKYGEFVHHQPGISVHEAGKRMANYATRLKTLIGTDEDGEPLQDPHFHTHTDSDWAADGFAYLEYDGEKYASATCG